MEHLNPEFTVAEHWAHLWEWFWELSAARSQGFSGPNPISYSEIADWAELTGNLIRRVEIAIIRKMDAAFLSANAVEQAEAAERAKQKKD
ncbi:MULTISPECIES: phage tail assembly chaperone [Chelativorans]|jgi:hypothetical protein|uniref:RNA polymerase sigma-70 domain-containing protein n=1 Tax=Chelativorans sp. (strain BNC1) TaxID=266779 RepID=Q11IZ9_CHESB|nr:MULTISPECIES: hypothetical protein [Chelativorans]